MVEGESESTQAGSASPRLNIALPAPTDQADYDIEELDFYKPMGIYRLSGWSFLTLSLEAPASQYARRIVLMQGDQNYVFHANPISRADIESRFSEIQTDLVMSGFSDLIDAHTVKSGNYRLGVLFTDRKNGQDYLLLTSRCLVRTENALELEPADSAACKFR
jgi:hypothetical protein